MDGATIQQRIYAGRAKAALRIGLACSQYRPLAAGAPLGNLIGTILAAFNAGDSAYKVPNLPGDPLWYADLDGRVTQPGDYLKRVVDGATWFVAAQQQLLPIICVDCNRSIRITRENSVGAVGAVPYSGKLPTTETDILGAPGALWPASILQGGRKDPAAGLPAGVKNAGWKMMLPPSAPVVIQAADIVTDDLGRRYAIDSAELTDMGWRINANEVHS
jgi:hypothetical protein